MSTRIACLVLLLALPGVATSQSDLLVTTLDQMIDAYGGEKNLRKLDHMVQEWDLVALMGNRHGTDRRSIVVPDRLKVELTYPSKTETRLLSGDTGFVVFGDQPASLAKDPQTAAMRLQLMRLYSPLALRDRVALMHVSADNEQLVLTLWENELRADYHVNRETWHIEKVVGALIIGGGEMNFVTEYSDFAWVEGVLVHKRENKFAGGVNTAVLQLRNIEFGVAFDDDTFAPPSTEDKPVIASAESRSLATGA